MIFVFLFKRELLIEKESFRLILGVSIALFLVGVALHFTEAGQDSPSGALVHPLISLWLFRLFRRVFVMRFKHEPRDTFFNWENGLGADRLFNIVYFGIVGCLWMLIPFGMNELAKIGW